MALLPVGLSLVRTEREPLAIRICQAESAGPAFFVSVARLSIERFRKLAGKMTLPQGIRVGSKAAREHQQSWEELYCRTVILGWTGLTLQNFESLLAGEDAVGGIDVNEWKKANRELPFSQDLALYIYRNTWADRFGDRIFTALRDGADQDVEEEDEKNVD